MKLLLLSMFISCGCFVSCYCWLGCKSQYYKYPDAEIYSGETIIATPSFDRKRLGFDSIQLLANEGKVTANFCYPNKWLYARDTVYTNDTAYKAWGFSLKIAPDMYITMKAGKESTTFKDGYFDMTKSDLYCDSIIVDSFKIKITKINPK